MKTIDNEAHNAGRVISCLLQFYIAQEETKFGFSLPEAEEMLRTEEFRKLRNVRICGLMGMATFTTVESQIRKEFVFLRECFNRLKKVYFEDNQTFSVLSMGMSGDYKIAIEEGSTMIRTGSIIFGGRI